MADRLTQLQDAVNMQADNFCNSIGILQQCPGNPRNQDRNAPEPDFTLLFASLITRTAKDIDHLIESLPSEESSTELQLASLRRLEQENHESALKLKDVIERGEKLLDRIQCALTDISQTQIEMQKLSTGNEKRDFFSLK